MPTLQLATTGLEPVVLRLHRRSGAALRGMWDVVEHLLHEGTLPRVQSPVALDLVPAM